MGRLGFSETYQYLVEVFRRKKTITSAIAIDHRPRCFPPAALLPLPRNIAKRQRGQRHADQQRPEAELQPAARVGRGHVSILLSLRAASCDQVLQTLERRPQEKHSWSSRLFFIDVVTDCAERFLVELNCLGAGTSANGAA